MAKALQAFGRTNPKFAIKVGLVEGKVLEPAEMRALADLPSKEALRRFLSASPGRVGKTEIARHFGLSTDQRPALRDLLRSLKQDGSAVPAGGRGVAALGRAASARLPEMAVVEVLLYMRRQKGL